MRAKVQKSTKKQSGVLFKTAVFEFVIQVNFKIDNLCQTLSSFQNPNGFLLDWLSGGKKLQLKI